MDNRDLNEEQSAQKSGELKTTSDSSAEHNSIEVEINKIPTPTPDGMDSDALPPEAPLTDDTIAIKRPLPPDVSQNPISFEKEQPPPNQEPERRLKIFCHNCGQKLDLTDMKPFSEVECPSCSGAIIVPKWWDNYLLEESCGIGGMAKVFRGLDLALDREVAIKILNNDIADDSGRNKLFLHEARTAATLNHYAILPIYTCGEFEDQAYLIMQYMGGGALDQELERDEDDPLKVTKACKWLKDICEALDNARRHGIIHHDIKPANFMIDKEGNVKIGDFGISQALYDSRTDEVDEITKSWGSPDYVSPEKVLTGKESYLGDIYSLGATFYHLLAGETPFDNHDQTELLKSKTVKDPIDIRKLREDIPENLAKLLMSMMNRTPEARPGYRDIIAELNSMNKTGAGKKKAATPVKASVSKQKTQVAAKKNINMNIKKQNVEFDPAKYGLKKKNPIVSLIKAAVILGVLAYGGHYLWNSGYLAEIIPGAPGSMKADYFPDVTNLVKLGNSIEAVKVAGKALDAPPSETNAAKQVAIQLAISTYLNNEKNADRKCSFIAERLLAAGVDESAPELAILRYLSLPALTFVNLRSQLFDEEKLRLAGEVAIFVKETYNKGKEKDKRLALRTYSMLSAGLPTEYWGRGWDQRVKLWNDWIFAGKGNKSYLEPLIRNAKAGIIYMDETSVDTGAVAPSDEINMLEESDPLDRIPTTSLTMDDLTAEWLQENRSFAADRPKAEDFVLNDEVLQPYFSGLSEKHAENETLRISKIKNLKPYLCKIMLRKPYKGKLKLKREDGIISIQGTVMVNSKCVMICPEEGKSLKVQWKDLHVDQFAKLLFYYARREEAKNKIEAAEAYLRIAVLCDWYGRYKNAAALAKRAVSLDSTVENKAIILMLE